MVNKQVMLFLLFLALMSFAAASEFSDSAVVEIAVEEYASVVGVPESSGFVSINYLHANVSLFPKEFENQVLAEREVRTMPKADVEYAGDRLFVKWTQPTEAMMKFTINAKVRNANNIVRVPSKISFPRTEPYRAGPFDRDIDQYTKASEFIDITPEIRQKSAEILEGETDYYRAVFRTASWVNENINYSLDTMTEDAVQKASWVLENRYGVCDEITALFMALLRAANIPARFVAGQVYSEKDESFGNHGWAEVYFPGYGWAPFDVTFRQFGWVDPVHLKLSIEADPSEPSVSYSWKASQTKMNINHLTINAWVVSLSGTAEKHADISVEPLRTSAANGSYVPFKVTVKNLEAYYLPLLVHITKAPDLLEDNSRAILLAPHEEKSMFWIASLPEDASPRYVYTTTIEANAVFAGSAESQISFSAGKEYFSKEWAVDTVERLSPHEEKEFLPDLAFECTPVKEYYYRSETAEIKCSLENKGNTNFKPLKVCLEAQCKDADMLIGEKKEVSWLVPLSQVKASDFVISAESRNMMKYAYPKIRIIEEPVVQMSDFRPLAVEYGLDTNLSFFLKSDAEAKNITMDVKNVGYSSISSFSGVREIMLPFNSRTARYGFMDVKLTYYDEVGKEYSSEQRFSIEVVNIPWHVRLGLWIEQLLPFVSF
ncbi:MAG: transglutaminase-like domain-containing protein [Candidatus Nanoarchaeia archaeon]|nr:transglutaminase-like domain-containing protein [Candidatus Nanoarchaeia archaeon]